MIRPVDIDDAGAIAEIYNWYIANTVITFETEPVSSEEIAVRLSKVDSQNPWLVMEEAGIIVGYAYAGAWKPRTAYQNSKETSIYLHNEYHGGGRGYRLMQALIEELRNTPTHALIAGIALPNEGSVALHEKLAFKKIGQFEEVGFKFDNFVDVGYWQLIL